jgi:hypothetical protein
MVPYRSSTVPVAFIGPIDGYSRRPVESFAAAIAL